MNPSRVGNFTSSEIVALTKEGKVKGTFGDPAMTYIEECNMERRLGRALMNEIDARPTQWGYLCEPRVFELLPIQYKLCSQDTIDHPEIPFWKGTPDANKFDEGKTVADIKCPFTLKSFCQLVDPYTEKGKIIHEALTIEAVRANHKEGDTYYWQIVSNAILTGSKYGELIVYCPYLSELQSIRDMASSAGETGANTKWIYWAQDNELPHLIDGGHYKNLNVIRFEIPKADKDFLTQKVLSAGEHLIEFANQTVTV